MGSIKKTVQEIQAFAQRWFNITLRDHQLEWLRFLIKGGNQYKAFVRSTTDGVKVFIREIFRSKKLANQPSFVSYEEDYQSFTPPDLVHDGPPELATEETGSD